MTKNKKNIEFLFYIFCLLAASFFVYLRGQDRNFDLLNYHFYQGYSLLNGRFVVDIAAAGLQSYLNPIANILAYLSLVSLPFPLSSWTILLVQLTAIPAIVLLAKEIGSLLGYSKTFSPTIPAVMLSLLAPLWISELGTTFFSSWTSPLILWGVYFLFTGVDVSNFSKLKIAISGFLFGLGAGLKLTNSVFAVSGFSAMIVLIFRDGWRTSVFTSAYFFASCCVGFGITAWWNWYLWSTWGSPFFPLYNSIFKSEFFDLVNFRDMRWHFSSIQDFLTFITQSAWGTAKTSEIWFADARYLLVTLLIPISILCRPVFSFNRQLMSFVVFMASSFLMWVLMFAYQRYLMPFELLLGLLIWILVERIIGSYCVRKAFMIGLVICVGLLMKAPDWGHVPMAWGEKNPFSVEMNSDLSTTPARYVVVGRPISYVLPLFHPDSFFYGVGLSSQVDDLIYKKLREASVLPVRVLTKDEDASSIVGVLKRLGYDQHEHSLDCQYFKTGLGRYIVCEVKFQKKNLFLSDIAVNVDFSKYGYLKFGGILWERGLSHSESWGRWSDGEKVELGLSECLPQGRMKLLISGRVFESNVHLPVQIALDGKEMTAEFTDVNIQNTLYFTNHAKCINQLVIKIPQPTLPLKIRQTADIRKLGFVSIKVLKEQL